MSESLQVAFIALTGVAIGGVLTGWFQHANTKILVAAELHKLKVQLEGEVQKRLLGRKQDWLMEAIPELVAAADTELHAQFDYARVVALIHRVQLLPDPNRPVDARLNGAVSDLGFAVQAAESGNRDVSQLLSAQAKVTEAARELLRHVS